MVRRLAVLDHLCLKYVWLSNTKRKFKVCLATEYKAEDEHYDTSIISGGVGVLQRLGQRVVCYLDPGGEYQLQWGWE